MREPARTRAAAQRRYRKYLQLTLSCVSSSAQWYSASEGGLIAHLVRPQGVPLKGDGPTLYLGATQLFEIIDDERYEGEFKVSTQSYAYSITADETQTTPLLDWHWHPQSRPEPHLHVHGEWTGPEYLHKLHLPTARVSFESVVRFAIEGLGAIPARPDWDNILSDSERRFRTFRTWTS